MILPFLAFAELLFWETRVELPNRLVHSIQMALPAADDLDRHGNIVLPYSPDRGESISAVKARTILPSGTVVEAGPESLIDALAAKVGDRERRTLSVALPSLRPGAVVAYEWTETRREVSRVELQHDLPVRRRVVHFPPSLQPFYFHCADGSQSFPPRPARDPAYLLLVPRQTQSADSFWRTYAAELAADFAKELSPVPPRPGATLDELAEFCRREIKNVLYYVTAADRETAPNPTPAATLRSRRGTPHEINLLFAAMARAAGYTVLYTRVASPQFRRELLDIGQFGSEVIAVRLPEGLRFFNPGVPFLAPGLLDEDEEGRPALVAAPEGPLFVTLPRSDPARSFVERRAELDLLPDGGVAGEITLRFHGLQAVSLLRRLESQSPAERLAALSQEYPNGVLSALHIEESNPATVRFRLHLPTYAERTQTRLFYSPAFFPAHPAARDTVTMSHPPGFAPESEGTHRGLIPLKRVAR